MNAPLADRLRPQNLDEIAGQHHLLDQNKPLRRIIESGHIPNMVFYGPSGVGKTTLATIIAKKQTVPCESSTEQRRRQQISAIS